MPGTNRDTLFHRHVGSILLQCKYQHHPSTSSAIHIIFLPFVRKGTHKSHELRNMHSALSCRDPHTAPQNLCLGPAISHQRVERLLFPPFPHRSLRACSRARCRTSHTGTLRGGGTRSTSETHMLCPCVCHAFCRFSKHRFGLPSPEVAREKAKSRMCNLKRM